MTVQTTPQSATRRLIEQTHGRPLETLLRGYQALGWTQGRIAEELGVSRVTVNRWFRAFGLR
jgi:DNA-binding transcriptional regulator LsrR (DeoR family)